MWLHGWLSSWPHNWFGAAASAVIPGSGPEGVSSFSLDLENGYQVTYRWTSDIIKTRSGKEQRISRNDHPMELYAGSALLFDEAPAQQRALLARYAAQGKQFTLGLPHEEMTFRIAAAGTTVYVESTTAADWMNPGQRVIVRRNRLSVEAVIQSTTANSITLDVDPGTLGGLGGAIMPSVPIFLEPEQAFARYAVNAERWNIQARAATFDFAAAPATLALGPLTTHAGLDAATMTARTAGTTPSMTLINSPTWPAGYIAEAGNVTYFYFQAGVTTLAQFYAAMTLGFYALPTGTWGSGTMTAGDAFAVTAFTGGTLAGPMGTGATLATYAGDGTSRPLWDRKLDNDGEIVDSIHSMTEILDFGGLPYSIGSADYADWGRAVAYRAELGLEWQWFKLFMYTVKGRQKAFWLSTWRDDLPFLTKSTNVITVAADVAAWWPAQRQHVQIVETSGTITRAKITAALDNGNGTWTLTIGTTLASSSVEMVSWLELCRFTADEFPVSFSDGTFAVETTATVVQR